MSPLVVTLTLAVSFINLFGPTTNKVIGVVGLFTVAIGSLISLI